MKKAPPPALPLVKQLCAIPRAKKLSLALGLALVLLGSNLLLARNGLKDLVILHGYQQKLALERELLARKNQELRDQSRRLRSDDSYLEAVIRSELAFVRPDEIVYIFGHGTAKEPVQPGAQPKQSFDRR
ncbi:MAG: septum formation initiator family protein [Deltaproteobacteria bacterium]|jgi:cell division protein FtsB|nr:septum formation initiator family protein [Deltaproteobacteria bacterium]